MYQTPVLDNETSNSEDDVYLTPFDGFSVRLGDITRGERATLGKSLTDVERDLKLNTRYILAIEAGEKDIFESPGFIPGYVRSYARYLGLDPEWAFAQFCSESGFECAKDCQKKIEQSYLTDPFEYSFVHKPTLKPHKPPERIARALQQFSVYVKQSDIGFANIPKLAWGSIITSLVLLVFIGYGGSFIMRQLHKVELVSATDNNPAAPFASLSSTTTQVENASAQTPATVLDYDDPPQPISEVFQPTPFQDDNNTRVFASAYPQTFTQSVFVSRDGPISDINHKANGIFVAPDDPPVSPALPPVRATEQPILTAANTAPPVFAAHDLRVFTIQPAWMQIKAKNGTVLFEKILHPGKTYTLPLDHTGGVLWAGNAETVFIATGAQYYGPIGQGKAVVRNVVLDKIHIAEHYPQISLEALRKKIAPSVLPSVLAALTEPAIDSESFQNN